MLKTLFFSIAIIAAAGFAQGAQYYDGQNGQPATVGDLLKKVGPGTVLITSEIHNNEAHHQNQRDLLVNFSPARYPISVGMEFFYYPQQKLVDDFTSGKTDEATFLKQIDWKGQPFEFYRFQVVFPHYYGGQTVALNFPRELSGKVAKGGLEALSDAEKLMMPPNFERGSQSYFERFHATMKDHAPEAAIQNYFTAQSLWDDTMAWQAASYMKAHADGLLVVIVGDFHVAYQDGLIARLKKRGVNRIVSLSQIDTTGLSDEERKGQIAPHPTYGPRADFIFDAR